MVTPPLFEPGNAILCEDVRQEKSNKYILIGVYAGDILTESLPADLPLCIYIDGRIRTGGQHTLFLRLSGPGEGSGVIGVTLSSEEGGTVAVATPRIDVHMEHFGTFRVEVSDDRETWVTLIEKQVSQESNLWTLSPIGKPPPSEQSRPDALGSSKPRAPKPPSPGKPKRKRAAH